MLLCYALDIFPNKYLFIFFTLYMNCNISRQVCQLIWLQILHILHHLNVSRPSITSCGTPCSLSSFIQYLTMGSAWFSENRGYPGNQTFPFQLNWYEISSRPLQISNYSMWFIDIKCGANVTSIMVMIRFSSWPRTVRCSKLLRNCVERWFQSLLLLQQALKYQSRLKYKLNTFLGDNTLDILIKIKLTQCKH